MISRYPHVPIASPIQLLLFRLSPIKVKRVGSRFDLPFTLDLLSVYRQYSAYSDSFQIPIKDLHARKAATEHKVCPRAAIEHAIKDFGVVWYPYGTLFESAAEHKDLVQELLSMHIR